MHDDLFRLDDIVAGDDAIKDILLTYGPNWSGEEKGQSIAEADVDGVFFYIKEKQTSSSAFVSLSAADSAQISWVADGHIRITIPGSDTLTKAGPDRFWELKIVIDGKYKSVRTGLITVRHTATGRPATS